MLRCSPATRWSCSWGLRGGQLLGEKDTRVTYQFVDSVLAPYPIYACPESVTKHWRRVAALAQLRPSCPHRMQRRDGMDKWLAGTRPDSSAHFIGSAGTIVAVALTAGLDPTFEVAPGSGQQGESCRLRCQIWWSVEDRATTMMADRPTPRRRKKNSSPKTGYCVHLARSSFRQCVPRPPHKGTAG